MTNGHVGRYIDGFGALWIWCRSEEFRRKNVVRVLSGEEIMCIKYMISERGKEEGDIQNGRK